MAAQLTLPIELDETFKFENFNDATNASLIKHIKALLSERSNASDEQSYYGGVIWGESSSGKTHFLAAISDFYRKQLKGKVCWLEQQSVTRAQATQGDAKRLYIFDDLDEAVDDLTAEKNLLSIVEQIKQQNSLLIISSKKSAKRMSVTLADLSSRLQAMDSFELNALEDEHKREVLTQKARQRGFSLSDDVLNWLLTHTSRDLGVLSALLDQIDEASLAQHRKVTIPLIKAILEVEA